MKNNPLNRHQSLFLIFAISGLSACDYPSKPDLVGFNFLQDENTAMNSTGACLSMQHLRLTGANSVVLIPFLKQESPQSVELSKSDAVTDEQLIAALELAKTNHLHRVLKPQILIENSWAGEITQQNPEQETNWFVNYTEQLLHYAHLAEKHQVDAFVIGTELKKIQTSEHWPELIKQVRSIYSGKLTYAAGEVAGIEAFPYWDLLDTIGVTLYPDMTQEKITDTLTEQLETLANNFQQPVWILEIGIPSAKGWESRPWDWRSIETSAPSADPDTQATIIRHWLTSLEKSQASNIEGIWIWQWSSSPQAGGRNDTSYTVQNKLAQAVVHQHWRSPLSLFMRKVSECTS
ncbi:MAG: hypothetical protein AB8D52_08740 [Gammaproteobacteria bacterium]